ncbi:hypothetical protein SAOR_03720 [Salinisphaera orenii MK-B5]|uniref:Sel1 repeat family protein n=1 Tax=Salinisphaera orenii MK-B5 TaxID=856730 RepID=A0A423PUB7_9GAMM|nr:tetratricopeptide repeat protein [Salinisphaera orenii]ROO29178.1 hypothetical protein SAOR_03720 [Salinisphaera orenii MK-B5]
MTIGNGAGPRLRGTAAAIGLLLATSAVAQTSSFGTSPATGDQDHVAREMVRVLKAYAVYKSGDYEAAFERYRALAEAGSVQGMTNLANMYAAGEGTERDEARALTWYRRAAEQGSGNAMLQLALAYRDGRGTTADAEAADRWLREAAEQDTTEAQWLLGRRLYARGEHLAGLEWIRTAAWTGNDPEAQQFLVERGEGEAGRGALDAARREAVLATLRAVDEAAGARDAAGIVARIDRDAEIRVRLPNGAGWTRLTRAELETLWRDTFEQADAYRYRRGTPQLLATEDGVLAFSEIEERLGTAPDARELTLSEAATLRVHDGTATITRLRLDIDD